MTSHIGRSKTVMEITKERKRIGVQDWSFHEPPLILWTISDQKEVSLCLLCSYNSKISTLCYLNECKRNERKTLMNGKHRVDSVRVICLLLWFSWFSFSISKYGVRFKICPSGKISFIDHYIHFIWHIWGGRTLYEAQIS